MKSRPPISHKDFIKIDKDYEAAASMANLIYVTDKEPGIKRVKKGTGFTYFFKNELINDPQQIERIKKLVLPPAWTNVWICRSPDGHIQATGFDVRGRKQYRYHQRWSALQQETKFHRMYEFGKALPDLRTRVNKDLLQEGFPETKVLAIVVSLMEMTYIRVGSEGYEKLYGSYGLTTLKNNHVSIQGDRITFAFKGKKGIYHKITVKNKKFARIIRQCRAIPGRELFQYYDQTGAPRKVDSGQVNQYLRDCLQQDFTTKDFRTWAGSLLMLRILQSAAPCSKAAELQKNIVDAFREVSQKLGNTVAVCKKYYVHPELVSFYQNNQLSRFLHQSKEKKERSGGLLPEEHVLMRILIAIQKEQAKPGLTAQLLKSSVKKELRKSKRHSLAA